jgi:hypothetical protein
VNTARILKGKTDKNATKEITKHKEDKKSLRRLKKILFRGQPIGQPHVAEKADTGKNTSGRGDMERAQSTDRCPLKSYRDSRKDRGKNCKE